MTDLGDRDVLDRLLASPEDDKELAAALLLAPFLGAVAPYIRMQACRRLDHPLTPGGYCPCGAVKR